MNSVELAQAGLPQPRLQSGAFSTEAFIRSVETHRTDDLRDKRAVLVKLTRKVEISRTLYAFYSSDLLRPVAEDLVCPEYVVAFCRVCLVAAQRLNDLRFLNCSLKMLDGILLRPRFPEVPETLQREALGLIQQCGR